MSFFFAWVDASEEGFGVIVEQNDDGTPHTIVHASQATNDEEKVSYNYIIDDSNYFCSKSL